MMSTDESEREKERRARAGDREALLWLHENGPYGRRLEEVNRLKAQITSLEAQVTALLAVRCPSADAHLFLASDGPAIYFEKQCVLCGHREYY